MRKAKSRIAGPSRRAVRMIRAMAGRPWKPFDEEGAEGRDRRLFGLGG